MEKTNDIVSPQTIEFEASAKITIVGYSPDNIQVTGASISLHGLDEDDKGNFINPDGSYNESALEAILMVFKYGIANTVKYGEEKGYWKGSELSLSLTSDIIRISQIEQTFKEKTEETTKIIYNGTNN